MEVEEAEVDLSQILDMRIPHKTIEEVMKAILDMRAQIQDMLDQIQMLIPETHLGISRLSHADILKQVLTQFNQVSAKRAKIVHFCMGKKRLQEK